MPASLLEPFSHFTWYITSTYRNRVKLAPLELQPVCMANEHQTTFCSVEKANQERKYILFMKGERNLYRTWCSSTVQQHPISTLDMMEMGHIGRHFPGLTLIWELKNITEDIPAHLSGYLDPGPCTRTSTRSSTIVPQVPPTHHPNTRLDHAEEYPEAPVCNLSSSSNTRDM